MGSPIFGHQLPLMQPLRITFILLIAVVLLGSCKSRSKPTPAGEKPVEVADFIAFFPQQSLPFSFTDSLLNAREKDSLVIDTKVFSRFVPDSILAVVFGKNTKPKIYPLGRVGNPPLLLVKAVTSSRKATFIVALDRKNQFVAALTAQRSDLPTILERTTTIDSKLTITKSQERKNRDGSISEGRDVYVLNEAGRNFSLIMTDALDDKPAELVNPIDTLPRKNKVAADYTGGKMNLVSIRDGRRSDRLTFFIHFEKGDCNGELKGEAMIKSPTLAEYREPGDPCVLQFKFTPSSITLAEEEGCGAHRGLRCSFNGTFARKKEVKPKSTRNTKGK